MKNKIVYKIIGEIIKTRRKELGLTQENLAEKIKLSRPGLANIESGRQGILVHSIYEIAEALDLKPHDLVPLPRIEKTVKFIW